VGLARTFHSLLLLLLSTAWLQVANMSTDPFSAFGKKMKKYFLSASPNPVSFPESTPTPTATLGNVSQDLDRWATGSPVTLETSFTTTSSFNDSIVTPLRQTSYSSTMIHTPVSSFPSPATTNLFFETPKDQIRASYLISGQAYDWNKTTKTSEASLNEFYDVFKDHHAPVAAAPIIAAPPALERPFPCAPFTQTKVRYSSLFEQSKFEQTTEEEISFTLSQDMEMESSQDSPFYDFPPSIQRCVSASIPTRPSSVSSRRGGRSRSISVDTHGPSSWNIDGNGPQFSDYRSPRHCSGATSRRKRCIFDKDGEDHDDRPIFTPPCSENGSRCTSTVTLDSQFIEVTSTNSTAVPPQNLGSMFGSPNLSMDSLALSLSPGYEVLPPPPAKRSKSVPPLPPHLEMLDLADSPPPAPVAATLFCPPRNRRGRSESFTDDFATTFSAQHIPTPAELLTSVPDHGEEGDALFTPISSHEIRMISAQGYQSL
jgi:hypothetical protein